MTEFSPELLDRFEKLSQKQEQLIKSPEYIQTLETFSQVSKNQFELLDKSFSIISNLHKFELKTYNLYFEIVKFLSPIFATALIAGVTIALPNIKTNILTYVGGGGLGILVIILFYTVWRRGRVTKRQMMEYQKVARQFQEWKKFADIHQKELLITDNTAIEDIQKLMKDMSDINLPTN